MSFQFSSSLTLPLPKNPLSLPLSKNPLSLLPSLSLSKNPLFLPPSLPLSKNPLSLSLEKLTHPRLFLPSYYFLVWLPCQWLRITMVTMMMVSLTAHHKSFTPQRMLRVWFWFLWWWGWRWWWFCSCIRRSVWTGIWNRRRNRRRIFILWTPVWSRIWRRTLWWTI